MFLSHFPSNTYLFRWGSQTKCYGSTFISDYARGGYPSLAGEFLDCRIDMVPSVGAVTARNCIFRVGGVGFIGFAPTVWDKNKVIIASNMVYCYQNSLTLNNMDYEFDGGSVMMYLYQTYTPITITFNNPAKPLPSQASSPRTMNREVQAQSDIHTCLNYDNTGGYTNQTTEARDATVDDVDLTGATGVPEVNDAIYFRRYSNDRLHRGH